MSIYRDMIRNILQEQRTLLQSYKSEMESMPEGHLVRSTCNGIRYYYKCPDRGQGYSKSPLKGMDGAVEELARKEFLKKSIEVLSNNVDLLERADLRYKDEDFAKLRAEMKTAYRDLPDEYFLKSLRGNHAAYRNADDYCLKRHIGWAAEPYEKSKFNPEGLRHPTSAGIKVRSKSEQHIVEQLVNYGVPFRYEQVLRFDEVVLSADFTFEDYQCDEFYWEHAGMMDLDSYRNRHDRKMKIYEANGIVPWRNLIVTYDSDGSVNVPLIKSIIENEIIPRM